MNGLDIAAEFRLAKRSNAGDALRLRLRQAIAAEQSAGNAPSWQAWQQRQRRLEQRVPGFMALMLRAHGGATVETPPAPIDESPWRAAWTASSEPCSPARVTAQWQRFAVQYGLQHCDVRFEFAAPRASCRVLTPGHAVTLALPGGDSAAAWHDCLHEMGHAIVALVTAVDVPRAVDEAAAEVIAADLEKQAPHYVSAASHARARRKTIAQRLAYAELNNDPTDNPTLPWALWHDPGVQAAYVAAHHYAAPHLVDGFSNRDAVVRFVTQHRSAIDGAL